MHIASKLDDAGRHRRLKMDPERNRHLLWTGLCIPNGKYKYSKYYKRTRTEDTATIWTTELHFFRPKNIL